MVRRIGLGVVGAGRMGGIHARLIAALVPEARLVGIADVDIEAARRLADRFGVAAYDDASALARSPGVNGIVVAASSAGHLEVVLAAANAGRDILCEKPLALTRAIRLVEGGHVDLRPIVSAVIPLAETVDGLASLRSGSAVKVVVVP
jgi:predicted dehydrogenase